MRIRAVRRSSRSVITSTPAPPDSGRRPASPNWSVYAWPIAAALAITAAGLGPWTALAGVNARVRPDLPWAAAITVAYLAVLVAWLHGWGPPARNSGARQRLLGMWPARPSANEAVGPGAVVAMLAGVYVLWTLMSRASAPPDLSAYPTTAYRWSMLLMGALTAGVVEEAAFRGYLQRGLEPHDRDNAVWITSLVFVASHLTQGLGAVLVMGPGLFIASMLYGTLARSTGSILPGMAIHVLGDLARVYVGTLHGDARLLFVP